MKNSSLHSIINFFFLKFIIIIVFTLIFFVSCMTQESDSGNSQALQNKVGQVKANENETIENVQNYLLVGAKGRYGRGSVFKCKLDGSECDEFLGGGLKFHSSADHKHPAPKLFFGDNFGSSISVTKDKILIGAMRRNNKKATDAGSISSANFKDDIGSIFRCNFEGTECSEFLGGQTGFKSLSKSDRYSINLLSGDSFGSSIYVVKDKILIGATGRDSNSKDEIGSIFQCSLDGKNCIEFLGGKSKVSNISQYLESFDALGSSIYSSNTDFFIGAKNKDNGNGGVFKCKIDGKKCENVNVNNLRLITNDSFGTSLVGNSSHIFVGAMGRNGLPTSDLSQYDIGAVFKCKIDGTNCIEIVGGQNKTSAKSLNLMANDYLGSSLAVFGNYLYIGAMGRKNNMDMKTGSVFRCNLDGKECIEFLAGKNEENVTSENIDLLDGDLFGSSLTVVNMLE